MQATKWSRRAAIAAAMAGIATGVMPAPVAAQDFPNKPISIVVPFGPGTANDIIARQLAQDMMSTLGQSVIVDNRPAPRATSRPILSRNRDPTATRC